MINDVKRLYLFGLSFVVSHFSPVEIINPRKTTAVLVGPIEGQNGPAPPETKLDVGIAFSSKSFKLNIIIKLNFQFPSLFNRLPTLHGSAGFRYIPSASHITAGQQLCVRVQKSFFVSFDHKYDANISVKSAKFWHWTNYFLFLFKYFLCLFSRKSYYKIIFCPH